MREARRDRVIGGDGAEGVAGHRTHRDAVDHDVGDVVVSVRRDRVRVVGAELLDGHARRVDPPWAPAEAVSVKVSIAKVAAIV